MSNTKGIQVIFLHIYKYASNIINVYYMYVCICKSSSYREGHVFRRTEEMGGEEGVEMM